MEPAEPRATANESYDARSWAPAAVISTAVASVRNVMGPPIGGAASGAVRGPAEGTWMRRTRASAKVTRIRTTRRAVWPCLLSEAQAGGLGLGFARCVGAHTRLLAQNRNRARSASALLGDNPRRLEDSTLEDERVIIRRVIRSA